MVSLHKDAARKVFAGRDAVDPGDGVFRRGALREREELVDADELLTAVIHQTRDDRAQTNLRPADKSGQAHTSNRRGIPIRIYGLAAQEPVPIRANQLELRNVMAKGPRDMMILSMDIVGDRTAD